MKFAAPPPAQGLYDPRHEHDACGVGFVVDLKGRKSPSIVKNGLEILLNLEHRGACGCEKNTGDGAGILMQVPHRFLVDAARASASSFQRPGQYGVGMVFLPHDPGSRAACEHLFEKVVRDEGQTLPRLARGPHRQQHARPDRQAIAAGHQAALRRPQRGRRRR